MRLLLGVDGRDPLRILQRWASEIRKKFILGDEDYQWQTWTFEVTQLRTSTAGVTFSNMNLSNARYLHVGKLCHWELSMTVQGSADYASIIIPRPPVALDFAAVAGGIGHTGRTPRAYGRLTPCRATAVLGAVSLQVPPCLAYASLEGMDFSIVPALSPLMTFYTNLGATPTTIQIGGSFPTKYYPSR